MKVIESVKIILPEPGIPQSMQIFFNVKETDQVSARDDALMGNPNVVSAEGVVLWPVRIECDGNGCFVLLRMAVSEIRGVAVPKFEEA